MITSFFATAWKPLLPHSAQNAYLRALAVVWLLCSVAFAQPSQEQVHKLDWVHLGEWKGYSLNGLEVEALYVSDPVRSPSENRFSEIVEMGVKAKERRWAVRCTLGSRRTFEAACDFASDDGRPASTLVLTDDGQGHLLGATDLDVTHESNSRDFDDIALQLTFRRHDGAGTASWARSTFSRSKLTVNGLAPEERALVTLSILAMLPISQHGGRLDSYPVVAGARPPDRGQLATLAQLEAKGSKNAAPLLREHLESTLHINRKGGTYVERHPGTPRIAMGVQGGPSFAPAGSPQGGSVGMLGGVRTNQVLFALTFGLHLGEMHRERFPGLDNSIGPSAGFSFGLLVLAAQPIIGDLEGALGLEVAARLRVVNVTGWSEPYGTRQAGGSLAPIIGLQYPIWKMNKQGSRMLLTLDGRPEFRLWARPGITAPPNATGVEALRQGLSENDCALRTQLGLRFEL
jgi:hypothetical protein